MLLPLVIPGVILGFDPIFASPSPINNFELSTPTIMLINAQASGLLLGGAPAICISDPIAAGDLGAPAHFRYPTEEARVQSGC